MDMGRSPGAEQFANLTADVVFSFARVLTYHVICGENAKTQCF